MRIISQDGTIDVPYESGSLTIGNGKYEDVELACIFYHNFSTTKGTKLAEYNSKAKAQKAMEMLHRAYIGMPIVAVKDVEMDVKRIAEDIRNGFVQPMPLNEPKIECDIFQFPKDEDLEV